MAPGNVLLPAEGIQTAIATMLKKSVNKNVGGQFHEFVAFSAIFQNCSIATSSIRIKPLKSLLYGTS